MIELIEGAVRSAVGHLKDALERAGQVSGAAAEEIKAFRRDLDALSARLDAREGAGDTQGAAVRQRTAAGRTARVKAQPADDAAVVTGAGE